MYRKLFPILILIVLFSSCSPLKYVPKDDYLLNRISIDAGKDFPLNSDVKNLVRQQPNHRLFGLININTFWYNLSGQDTTKWINRALRKIGDAPVVYDKTQTELSRMAMERFLVNRGYFDAKVDTATRIKCRRIKVTYKLNNVSNPYTIGEYKVTPGQDTVVKIISENIGKSVIKSGSLFSSDDLDEERARLTRLLQEKGYYAISKDNFSFVADSAVGKRKVNVRLVVKPFVMNQSDTLQTTGQTGTIHPVYKVNKIYFMLDVPTVGINSNSVFIRPGQEIGMVFDTTGCDTIQKKNFFVVYKGKPFVRPDVLIQKCRIVPGALYDIHDVEKTYENMNALETMKYVNIRFLEATDDTTTKRNLDCYIMLTPSMKQSFSAEIEGTNTAGDLGVAGNIAFTHRNLLKGAETFQAKFLGAYEALSTSFTSDYTELGGELALTLPDFKAPFLSGDFKRKVDANTEFAVSYQNMSRPEFARTVASASVRYNWTNSTLRQTLDLVNLSYVYMPRVDSAFKATYLTNRSYLKYSYEDHFILRSAYSFSYSSVPIGSSNRTYYTWRGSVESAGNALYALYSLAGAQKDNNTYKIGNISFAQYVKGETEYAKSVVLDSKTRFAYRAGLGIAYPYGNSQVLPFEKRFFSGGANSVRGWSVRTLGPGSYSNKNGGIDFMNQSGDIKLDLGAEYRSNLFGKLEGALFTDMGNIWTIRNYEGQPGGQFKLSTFYKQIAGSVGAGLRFDFSFFLLRLDLGMKVYDPSLEGEERWRIRHIDNRDDFAIHLAIGYPF